MCYLPLLIHTATLLCFYLAYGKWSFISMTAAIAVMAPVWVLHSSEVSGARASLLCHCFLGLVHYARGRQPLTYDAKKEQ